MKWRIVKRYKCPKREIIWAGVSSTCPLCNSQGVEWEVK
jgi:hypothetical protein